MKMIREALIGAVFALAALPAAAQDTIKIG